MHRFEWIGLTNGEAVVLHRADGHVYRFRPSAEAGWRQIVLSRQERGSPIAERPEAHAEAARIFAQVQLRPLLGFVLP